MPSYIQQEDFLLKETLRKASEKQMREKVMLKIKT